MPSVYVLYWLKERVVAIGHAIESHHHQSTSEQQACCHEGMSVSDVAAVICRSIRKSPAGRCTRTNASIQDSLKVYYTAMETCVEGL
jgi:hypothetical protein